MVKKANIRTLESFLAFILTFVFIAIISTQFYPSGLDFQKTSVLKNLEQNSMFRNCALINDLNCLNSIFIETNPNFPNRYNYTLSIGSVFNLPKKHIFVDSIFIASNLTTYNPVIVKLYYWAN
ncbi:hypothetical protein H8D83_01330 [Candidatus Woesearchaeota archaeon]|nr:hypothetical protein [Candidatus Woesearchaeota archaeon]MBL7050862.1 hypothetical protein [Candidatus Woesearchaeota archaeon]